MIFETHAHYDDDRFKDDRDETIKRVHEKGVAPIINVGASIGSTMTTMELAKKYDFIYAAVGVHPSDIADLNEETFAWLREQTAWERTVAVGEIGLDYYWDKEPNVQENQRYWFKRQLKLAAEAALPGYHTLARCCTGHHGNHDRGSKKEYPRRDTLLFLFTGDGTGVCKAGVLYRSWRCRNFQECKEAGTDSVRAST